ncbi:hypothetical protein NQ315_014226, partial [Exocentrus adspersus]
IFTEEISPKLEKLREERAEYLEYQRVIRELEHMHGLFSVWKFNQSKQAVANAEKELECERKQIKQLEEDTEKNNQSLEQLAQELTKMNNNTQSGHNIKLQELEVELKEKEKQEAKTNASIKTIKDNLNTEEKKKNQLIQNLEDDSKILQAKEEELNNVKSLFESLKENDAKDNDAFAMSQKSLRQLVLLMNARENAAKASTESKQALMQLTFCQTQLKEKQRELESNSVDYEKDQTNLTNKQKEVNALEVSMKKLNFSEEQLNTLIEKKRALNQDIRGLREKLEHFEARRPYTKFCYTDPEVNFNKHEVKGVVCRLIKCEDSKSCVALETAAGARVSFITYK